MCLLPHYPEIIPVHILMYVFSFPHMHILLKQKMESLYPGLLKTYTHTKTPALDMTALLVTVKKKTIQICPPADEWVNKSGSLIHGSIIGQETGTKYETC